MHDSGISSKIIQHSLMNDPLHIAIVFGSLRTGGAEIVMIRLANSLAEMNVRCNLVVLNDSGPLRSLISPAVNVVNLNASRARKGVYQFRKFLRIHNPDVLIISQTHIQIMALLAIKWDGWKGKVILNEHSLFTQNNKLVNKWYAKSLFRRADAVTAVSKAVADDYVKNFPSMSQWVLVINNAAFNPDILKLKSEQINMDSGLPFILSAGRLTASKNFKLLIDAFEVVLSGTTRIVSTFNRIAIGRFTVESLSCCTPEYRSICVEWSRLRKLLAWMGREGRNHKPLYN